MAMFNSYVKLPEGRYRGEMDCQLPAFTYMVHHGSADHKHPKRCDSLWFQVANKYGWWMMLTSRPRSGLFLYKGPLPLSKAHIKAVEAIRSSEISTPEKPHAAVSGPKRYQCKGAVISVRLLGRRNKALNWPQIWTSYINITVVGHLQRYPAASRSQGVNFPFFGVGKLSDTGDMRGYRNAAGEKRYASFFDFFWGQCLVVVGFHPHF